MHDILASSFHHIILDREMLGMVERNIVCDSTQANWNHKGSLMSSGGHEHTAAKSESFFPKAHTLTFSRQQTTRHKKHNTRSLTDDR